MTGSLSGKTKFESMQEERYLGVLIRSYLKSVSQSNKSAATARKVIGMVRCNFKHLDIDDFHIIYNTYICPHLEYCIQAWSSHLVKDIDILENVQKARTNLVPKLRKNSYPVRLQKARTHDFETQKRKRRHDRSLQIINWMRTDRLQTVVETSTESLWLKKARGEANKGKIMTTD